MRALHTREAAGIGIRRYGLGSYIVVGLLAVAVGVGAVAASNAITGEADAGLVANEFTSARDPSVLSGLESRYAAGFAQAAAIAEHQLLQSRIEAGLAQQEAIAGQSAFQEAWEMRGTELTKFYAPNKAFSEAWTMRGEAVHAHLYDLIAAGLVQQEAMSNR